MNLKDIKGDFKELYGGCILVDIVDEDSIFETYKNAICINEKYYNYRHKPKYNFDSLEDLYEEIEKCKENNIPRLILVTNMRELLKSENISEEYNIVNNLKSLINNTNISIEMIFKVNDGIKIDNNCDKLLHFVHRSTSGENGSHAIMYNSSYITIVKKYISEDFKSYDFKYNTIKNIPNDKYEKMKR